MIRFALLLLGIYVLALVSGFFSTHLPGTGSILDSHQTQALNILHSLASLSGSTLIDVTKPSSNWSPSLQSVLSRSKMATKMPRRIDLRFTDPVVTN